MDDPKTRILIVEDDENIALYIQTCLLMGDYENEIASDGLQAVDMINAGKYDLILLDIMLPGLDGFEVFKRTKESGVPVIFLTAMQSISDKVKGLRLGAEDYIVKPFEALELLARIEVVLRRDRKVKSTLSYGDIEIDVLSHSATRNGEQIPLTPKEFEVLTYFVRHQNTVISRDHLLAAIWGFEFAGETRTVDTHVQQVRRKMGLKGKLITVPKYGYKLTGSD
ncbi:MAG: response regulator transcription factor [Clostridiales bacterium]|nr:response regulator transcription factor [Clostridiales bacterium]